MKDDQCQTGLWQRDSLLQKSATNHCGRRCDCCASFHVLYSRRVSARFGLEFFSSDFSRISHETCFKLFVSKKLLILGQIQISLTFRETEICFFAKFRIVRNKLISMLNLLCSICRNSKFSIQVRKLNLAASVENKKSPLNHGESL